MLSRMTREFFVTYLALDCHRQSVVLFHCQRRRHLLLLVVLFHHCGTRRHTRVRVPPVAVGAIAARVSSSSVCRWCCVARPLPRPSAEQRTGAPRGFGPLLRRG